MLADSSNIESIINQVAYDLENTVIKIDPTLEKLATKVIAYKLNNKEYSTELQEIYNSDKVEIFFKDSELSLESLIPTIISNHLIKYLQQLFFCGVSHNLSSFPNLRVTCACDKFIFNYFYCVGEIAR